MKFPESTDPRSAVGGESIIASRKELAQSLNEILNALAARSDDRLLGPAELESRLKDAAVGEKVPVYLDDPGDIGEAWKTQGLSTLLGQCGVERLVRITALVETAPASRSRLSQGVDWHGSIAVRAELFTLSAPGTRAVGSGEAEFWGNAGIFGGYGAALPFAFGKTVGRAADQALRAALSDLRQKHVESPSP
jgi:hypothetical protein